MHIPDNFTDRVPAATAAAELQMNILTLQCLMQQDRLPIGYAVKRKSRYTYYIYRQLLDQHKKRLGIGGFNEYTSSDMLFNSNDAINA